MRSRVDAGYRRVEFGDFAISPLDPINIAIEAGVLVESPFLPGWAEGTKQRLLAQCIATGAVGVSGDEIILLCKKDGAVHQAWNIPLPEMPAASAQRIPRLVSAAQFYRELTPIELDQQSRRPYAKLFKPRRFTIDHQDDPTVLDAVLELSAKSGIPITCDAKLGQTRLDITLYHPLTVQDGLRVIAALADARIVSDGRTISLAPRSPLRSF